MNISELIRNEGFRRGLRPQTIKTYRYIVNKFLRIYLLDPFNVKKKDIEQHQSKLQEKNKSGSTLNVHPHSLRHSFATHILENGYSIMEVQPLLGHARLETTMIYAHLAAPKLTRVKSPYDTI